MICDWCGGEIHPHEYYLSAGEKVICKDCVENGMEEYDPEADWINNRIHEFIEERMCST